MNSLDIKDLLILIIYYHFRKLTIIAVKYIPNYPDTIEGQAI
jgi:hypothetical protein